MTFDFCALEADISFVLEAFTCIQELEAPIPSTARQLATDALCDAAMTKLHQQVVLVRDQIEAMRKAGEDPCALDEHPF